MSSVSSLNSLLSSSSSSSTSGTSSSSSLDISSLLAAATGATSVGIDVTAAVDAAIYAAQAPERQWQAEQATLQSQITAVSSVQTALTAVTTDLNSLNDLQGPLAARAVTSSNSSAVTASALAGTSIGTHVVTVNTLATSASWYSPSLASGSSSLGSSSLTITQNDGTQTSFDLSGASTNSLSSLASAINGESLGISASVVTDANGSRLALVSNSSGSNANFTVTENSSAATSWNSASLASTGSTLSAGTFQIGDGSSSATVNVTSGSTLGDVANSINALGMNLTASVVTDATGAHLAIAGNSGNSATMSSDPTFGFTQSSTGSNASLTVDGIPVSSASNTVTGVVPGLTIDLQGATSGAQITLGISADTSQISSAVTQFVNDYNSATSLVNSQFTYDSSTQTEGALGSDATVRSLQSMLLNIGSYTTSDTSTSSPVTSLASLGITMNDDGTLSVDTTTLDHAVQTNPAGVQNFFQGSALNGFASSVGSQIKTFNDPSIGSLTNDLSSMTQQYNDLQSDVNNYETGYIASQRTVLTSMYSQAEIALQQLPTTMKQLQAQLGQS